MFNFKLVVAYVRKVDFNIKMIAVSALVMWACRCVVSLVGEIISGREIGGISRMVNAN